MQFIHYQCNYILLSWLLTNTCVQLRVYVYGITTLCAQFVISNLGNTELNGNNIIHRRTSASNRIIFSSSIALLNFYTPFTFLCPFPSKVTHYPRFLSIIPTNSVCMLLCSRFSSVRLSGVYLHPNKRTSLHLQQRKSYRDSDFSSMFFFHS